MTTPINQRMGPGEWAILIFLSILWGGSFFFISLSLHSFPPLTLVWLRCTLASLILYTALRLTGRRLPATTGVWLAFLILGLLNIAIPFALYAWSQTHITAGLASILNATTPLWSILVCHFLTRDEKATIDKMIGVLCGLGGVIMMIGGEALTAVGGHLLAQIACLIAAASYAFASIYGRRFKTMGIEPIQVSAGQLITSAALLLPIALAADKPWTLPTPHLESVIAMALLAIFSTSLAYILYFRLLETAGATNSLLVTFLVPVTAILLGTLILGETLAPRHWAGMALITLGLAAIDGRLFSHARAARSAPPD